MSLLATLRAHRLRTYIQRNRCPVRPGITHHWIEDSGFDPTSFGAVIEWIECAKCHQVEP